MLKFIIINLPEKDMKYVGILEKTEKFRGTMNKWISKVCKPVVNNISFS